MLDKEDILVIGEIMDTKLAQQKTEIMQDFSGMFAQQKTDIMQDVSEMFEEQETKMIGMFAQQKTDIMQDVSVLMDSKFTPQFKLLAEGQQAILDKLIPVSRVEELEEKVRFLEVVVRKLSEDMLLLKKA